MLRDGRIGRLDNPAGHPWRRSLAEVLDRLERRDEAAELAQRGARARPRLGRPGPIGRALRVLGTAERERGIDHLSEAVEVLDGSQARLELAQGAVRRSAPPLRLAAEPSEAREPLYRALELASVSGATALARARAHRARAPRARGRGARRSAASAR